MLLAAGLAYSSSAQLLIGPKIGVNFATLRAIKVEGAEKEAFNDNNEYKTGMHFGLALHKGFNQRFAFQTELLFTQLGSKSISPATATTPKGELNLTNSYLQVPAMIKVVFGEGDVNFFINAGPYVGFWTARQVANEDPGDFSDKFNRWDVGLNGGAGLSIKAGPGFATLEGRYGFGLLSLYNDSDITDVTNRAIGVSLSYLFGNPND